MVLTNERAELLANYLAADTERAQALLELSPEEAVAKINADGNDFTVEEVKEFGEQMKKVAAVAQNDELDEDALTGVAGGLAVEGVAIACITLGFRIGSSLAQTWGW